MEQIEGGNLTLRKQERNQEEKINGLLAQLAEAQAQADKAMEQLDEVRSKGSRQVAEAMGKFERERARCIDLEEEHISKDIKIEHMEKELSTSQDRIRYVCPLILSASVFQHLLMLRTASQGILWEET